MADETISKEQLPITNAQQAMDPTRPVLDFREQPFLSLVKV